MRLEIEDLQALFRVCGCRDERVSVGRERQGIGRADGTRGFLDESALALQLSVEIPYPHRFADAAGCEVLSRWMDGKRGDATVVHLQMTDRQLLRIVDVERASPVATEQESTVGRKGEHACAVAKTCELGQLLAEAAPENDLVPATGEVHSVGGIGKPR